MSFEVFDRTRRESPAPAAEPEPPVSAFDAAREGLDLYPGCHALLVVEVEILRRQETPSGPVLSVLLPGVLTPEDFASPEAEERLLAARRRRDREEGSLP